MDHKPTDIVVRSNYQKGVPNWQQGDNTPKSLPIKSTNWIRWGGRRPAPDIDDNDIIDVEYRPVDDNRTGTRPTTGDRMRSLQRRITPRVAIAITVLVAIILGLFPVYLVTRNDENEKTDKPTNEVTTETTIDSGIKRFEVIAPTGSLSEPVNVPLFMEFALDSDGRIKIHFNRGTFVHTYDPKDPRTKLDLAKEGKSVHTIEARSLEGRPVKVWVALRPSPQK